MPSDLLSALHFGSELCMQMGDRPPRLCPGSMRIRLLDPHVRMSPSQGQAPGVAQGMCLCRSYTRPFPGGVRLHSLPTRNTAGPARVRHHPTASIGFSTRNIRDVTWEKVPNGAGRQETAWPVCHAEVGQREFPCPG